MNVLRRRGIATRKTPTGVLAYEVAHCKLRGEFSSRRTWFFMGLTGIWVIPLWRNNFAGVWSVRVNSDVRCGRRRPDCKERQTCPAALSTDTEVGNSSDLETDTEFNLDVEGGMKISYFILQLPERSRPCTATLTKITASVVCEARSNNPPYMVQQTITVLVRPPACESNQFDA